MRKNILSLLLFIICLMGAANAQTITEIIDATGDGTPGNPLEGPRGIAVDGSGNVYVTGLFSNNAFKIAASIHTITSSVGANGSIDPVGAVSVNNGVDQSFTITPNTGYLVADVLVDGNSVGAVTSYTFTNVLTDHTISATFKISSFGMKQAAKDLLIPYLTDPDKKIRKAVEKAIKHIDKSLEAKLWVDVNHLTKKGKKVFDEEKKAVKKLKNKKFIPPFSTDALAAINFLITADKNLAQVAINEVACNGDPKCEKELQKANKEMDKALKELVKNKYDKAIDHYKKAWQHAQKATKKAAVASVTDNNESISLDNTINIPVDFTLSQNYPNPFNPSTVIKYALPEASFVTLKIYNMLGQEIKTLVSGDKSAGVYNVQWNGKDNYGSPVASGTYIYRIVTGNYAQSNKMILLK
ncbi:MAG: T9SS type A sorting domain-containing protein [Bacteroidetes bacterium]|nr:T9SS type A sorting domain-containing protein [Bacteroidota bacterium]